MLTITSQINPTLHPTHQSEIMDLIEFIKNKDLDSINALLNEDLNDSHYGKYKVLAILRDLFNNYEEFGDTELIIELGKCRSECYNNTCKVFSIRGNHSNRNFSFVIEKEDESISGIHLCLGFIDQKNEHRLMDDDLFYEASKKEVQMTNRNDYSNWDDVQMKRIYLKVKRMSEKDI